MRRFLFVIAASCSTTPDPRHVIQSVAADPGPDPCPPIAHARISAPMTMTAFTNELAKRLDAHAHAREQDYEAFVKKNALVKTDTLHRDFMRARLLFEATRDGGFWSLRWRITNQDATSKNIWAQWRASTTTPAIAECDELSALYAALARGMGIQHVGLFWPTWNHTIAAWDVTPNKRVLVPTSQIFLGCDDTFDDVSFDPKHQKVVYEFPARDLGDGPISAELATFLLDAIDTYGDASSDVLAAIRIDRAIALGSSVPDSCRRALPEGSSCGDRRALEAARRPSR